MLGYARWRQLLARRPVYVTPDEFADLARATSEGARLAVTLSGSQEGMVLWLRGRCE